MKHPMGSGKPAWALDRADFLRLLGAAGLGAAAAGLPGTAEGAVSTDLGPLDFTFTRRHQFRPFDILAPNFVELDDDFDTDSSGEYAVLAPGPEFNAGTVEAGDGGLRISGEGHYTVLRSGTGQEAPYAAVVVDVGSLVGNGPGPEDSVFAGLYKDADNFVHAFYNNRTKLAGFDVAVNGEVFGLGTVRADLAPPFRFAFVANENEVTALVSTERDEYGFRPLIKRNVSPRLDLRDAAVLAEYKNGFGARANRGGTIVLDRVRAGYFGEAGLRDPHVVQYANGAPYVVDGKLYLTFTNAGLGFFEKAHFGVWTMDLSDLTKIEQVGNLFFARDDDKVLGHHAGQIVRDEREGRWIVLVSSWGDFGEQGGEGGTAPVDIEYVEVPAATDLLNGVHVLESTPHPVNALLASPGKWDPGVTRIADRWYFPFVIANELFDDFQPALAVSGPGRDHTALTLVGTDNAKNATEGPIVQKLGGRWRVFASNGDDTLPQNLRGRYPIYDLRMRPAGYLNAPHPTNIPHPMIVPLPVGKKSTRYIMVTFNGTQYRDDLLGYGTHGDLFVFEAIQRVRGREF